MSERGKFFAIGKKQWAGACGLGMNPAVALLVLACGTGRNNSTTTWSCEAVYKHTGITWRRARDAIKALESNQIVTTEKAGARPIRVLTLAEGEDERLWLPNALVVGAGAEVPPVMRLRQAADKEALQLLIELYGAQELAGDGGIPRSILRRAYERTKICGWGQFEVYGYQAKTSTAHCAWPLVRYFDKTRKDGDLWERVNLLTNMGLIECVPYLAESSEPDAELLHALAGDEYAQAVADSAANLADELPGGFRHEADNYEFVLPAPNHMKGATVVGVFRLHYRPKTTRTAAWFAQHVSNCERFATQYSNLARAEFRKTA